MTPGRHFARNGVVIFLGTSLGQLAQLALLATLAHVTTVGHLGRLLAVIGLLQIVVDLVDFGSGARLVRDSASNTAPESERTEYFTGRSTAGILAAALVACAGLALEGEVGSLLVWLSPWVAIRVASQARRTMLQIGMKFAAMSQAHVADKLTASGVGIVLLLLIPPIHALGIAYCAGALSSLAYAQLKDRSQPLLSPRPFQSLKQSYKNVGSFGVTLVITDLASLDLLILTWVAGAQQAGLFALPSRLAIPVTTLTGSLAAVALVSLAAQPDNYTAWRLLRAGTRSAVLTSAVGLVAAMLLARPALNLFGGAGYIGAVGPLRIFLLASLFAVVNQLMLAFLQSRGFERFAAQVLVCSVFLSLVTVAAGGLLAGALGASAGYLLGNLMIFTGFSLRIRSLLVESLPSVVGQANPITLNSPEP